MPFELNHLHLKTQDPDGVVKFYVEVLGARVTNKSAKGGYRVDLHGLPLNVTRPHEEQQRQQSLGMEHIAINSDEYDRVVAMLKERKVKILEETLVGDGKRACFFEGPDGVQLEFIEKKL